MRRLRPGRQCLYCREPLSRANHGKVHARCAPAFKAQALDGQDVDAVLSKDVHNESWLLPWERHPVPWDHVRAVGGAR